MEIIIPYLHFIGIMALMGSLITEHVILKPDISLNQFKSLGTIDLIYGISAVVVLVTGLLRWFAYGKGAEFYTKNPLFHTKLTLFVEIVVISIFPTMKFIRWSRQARRGEKPELSEKDLKKQLMLIRIQLFLLAVMPLLAVMIARGIGLR